MHVLITGAAGGLGRALAVECARRGYRLFLTDRNAQALCHIQDGLCRQFGVQVTAVPCDLTDSAAWTPCWTRSTGRKCSSICCST